MKKYIFFLFCAMFLFLAGCGNKVQFGGKVTFSDDGTPLTTGTVCFEGNNFLARGLLQSDGTYDLGSLKEKDGIPPGTYQVYISGASKITGAGKDGMAITEPLIDEKFSSPSLSGLVVEIPNPSKRFDIQVDRYR